MTIYALYNHDNIQYEYDFIKKKKKKKKKKKNKEALGSFRALLFTIYDNSLATNFP